MLWLTFSIRDAALIERWIKKRLERRIPQVSAVALLGARQVGKTTLAKSLAREMDSIYLDLESPEDLLKLQNPVGFLSAQGEKLIILDEIQRVPELFAVLRGVIDQNRERGRKSGQFLLLGSASKDLMRQSSESLAGRIHYMEMGGLNVLETGDCQRTWRLGGLPESYMADNDDVAMNWLEDLLRTYIERDIPQVGLRASSVKLRRLWTMLAHLQGESVNVSKLANNLEIQRSAVNHWMDVLTHLLLLRRLEPWSVNVKKRLVKSPRYYIRDSGILHRLLGIESWESLLSNPVLGKSWEGFVIENIHSVLPHRCESYFYRTAAGAEIDLLIKMPSSELRAVEIKYGVSPKLGKNYHQVCKEVGADTKYIIYGGDEEFSVGDGVVVTSLPKFMEKLQKEGTP